MANDYLRTEDGFKLVLEDGSGSLLLESSTGVTDVIYSTLHRIHVGMVANTAAGLGGVLEI